MKNVTPQEAWSVVKPSVEHFRVFGCVSHVHVSDARRTKLENKSFTCVLLGVSEESKAYRLYDPVSKKIVISRDVIFEEERQWDWDKSYEEQLLIDLEWNDDVENENVNAANESASESGDSAEESETDSQSSENASPNQLNAEGSSATEEERNRRPPVWMRDYVSGEGKKRLILI